jgi:transaldolase
MFYVKIPLTNTKRETACHQIKRLAKKKVNLNVRAVMIFRSGAGLGGETVTVVVSYFSVFAGRLVNCTHCGGG